MSSRLLICYLDFLKLDLFYKNSQGLAPFFSKFVHRLYVAVIAAKALKSVRALPSAGARYRPGGRLKRKRLVQEAAAIEHERVE